MRSTVFSKVSWCRPHVWAAALTAGWLGATAGTARGQVVMETSSAPIAPAAPYYLDGTVATQSDLGWDVTFVDHSDFTQPYFADNHNGAAYFTPPTASSPVFTTIGGTNNPGLSTNQPWLYVNFNNGYVVPAGVPALFTVWLGTDGPAEFDASLADASATMTPIDFSTPTEFQVLVVSATTQEINFSSFGLADGVEAGLFGIAGTTTVPEPTFLATLLPAALLLTRRRT